MTDRHICHHFKILYYLDRSLLLEINRLLERDSLVRDANPLESAINAPKQSAYYEGSDIITQAAILTERIVLNHPFVDGNKRTALIAGSTFLLINNLNIIYANNEEDLAYAKEIERLVVSKDHGRFLQWLRAHIFKHMMVEEDKAKKARPTLQALKAVELSMKQFAKELEYLKDR